MTAKNTRTRNTRLRLSTGPALIYCADGEHPQDVTSHAHAFLAEPFQADDDVTLGDYLSLLGTSPLLQSIYARDFAESIFEEAHKGPLPQEGEVCLDCLELYFEWRLDSSSQTYTGVDKLHLHGIGPAYECPTDGSDGPGERNDWSLTGCSLRELLPLPVRIRYEVAVIEADPDAHALGHAIHRVHLASVTLGQVLHGLLWELSFHGSPSETQEFCERMRESLKDIEAGTPQISHVTTGSVFEDLGLAIPRGIALMFDTIGAQDPWRLKHWLRSIPDQALACDAIEAEFKGAVVVRPSYRELSGYEFRRAFRLADEE